MSEKKPWSKGMKIANTILWSLLLIIVIVIFTSKPDSEKPVPIEQEQQIIADYYKQLVGYEATIISAYKEASGKAKNGDAQGAYLAFKGDTGTKISGARQLLYELSLKVPNVRDKKKLEDAASNLALAAYKLEESMKLFEEGVEKNLNGKILEATAASQKAAEYFKQASELLEQIATKFNIK